VRTERINSHLVSRAAIGLAIAFLSVVPAWAAEPPASAPAAQEPSRELREKMATVHEQMAACLRSDKSFADCRSQMHSNCRQNVGAKGCPMMGLGRGMGRGCMQPPPATTPPSGK
jgi:hypothetical protein